MTESREVAVRSGLKRELANNTTQPKPRASSRSFSEAGSLVRSASSVPARLRFEEELQLLWGQTTRRGDPRI